MNRYPRFACKAVYYNLYINEFFFRLNPCCYIQQIPGFEEIRFIRVGRITPLAKSMVAIARKATGKL